MKKLFALVLFSASCLVAAELAGTSAGSWPTGRIPGQPAQLHQDPTAPRPLSFDSLNCRMVGNWPYGVCYAVAGDTARHHVYLGSGGGVLVIDVTNPAAPRRVSDRLHSPGTVRQMVYAPANHLLYAATGSCGVEIWDMSNDSLPVFVARVPAAGYAGRLALGSHYLYFGDGMQLRIVDVSDPHNPHDTGSVALRRNPQGIAVSGSFVYVATYDTGLCVVDATNPASPAIAAYCEYPGYSFSLTLDGTHALVGGDTDMQVVDIQTPTNPQFVGGATVLPGSVYGIRVADTLAVVADGGAGLRIFNIASISAPELVDSVPISGGSDYGAALFGHYAAVVQDWGGLIMCDFAPGHAQQVGREHTPGTSNSVVVAGSYAFLAGNEYLPVVDLSNPVLPTEVARCSVGCGSVALVRGYLYAIPGWIDVYDISAPTSPHQVGSLSLPGAIQGFASDSFHACAATYDSGSYVLDVSNPVAPAVVGHCHTPGGYCRVALNGHFAYVNSRDSGLYVVSLADPAHPFVAGRCSVGVGSYGYAVAAAGHYVYAGAHDLTIVDVQDSAHPRIVGTLHSVGPVRAATAVDSLVYLAADIGGPEVCDVADTANPVRVAYHSGPVQAYGIAVAGNRLYLAETFCGLQVYDFTPSGVAERAPGQSPGLVVRLESNPVRNRASLLFSLPASCPVTVDVYDAAGRRCGRAAGARLGAGVHALALPTGHLASGVYLLRVSAGSASQELKLVRE